MNLSDEIIHQMYSSFESLEKAVQEAFVEISKMEVPLPLLPLVQKVVDEAAMQWNKACDWIKEQIGRPGSLSILSTTAEDWQFSIGAPISAKTMIADSSALQVDDHWKGSAAGQYKQSIFPQRLALSATKSQVDVISRELKSMSGATKNWIVTIGAGFIICCGACIAARYTAPGPAGIAAAIIAGVLSLVAAIITATSLLIISADNSATNLQTVLADNTWFPDAHWPKATI